MGLHCLQRDMTVSCCPQKGAEPQCNPRAIAMKDLLSLMAVPSGLIDPLGSMEGSGSWQLGLTQL